MKRKRIRKSKTAYEHYWCVGIFNLPASELTLAEKYRLEDTVRRCARLFKARSMVMGRERRVMLTVTDKAPRCSLVGREPGDDDRRLQIYLRQPSPLTERQYQEMRKEIEADGGRIGRPFKGVMGRDPVDGMNYMRGNGIPHWLKTTATILLEIGEGSVTGPQYVPASWTREGYHIERDRDGKLTSFHAHSEDLNDIMATIRRDIPELRDTEFQEATKSDLAKYLLDMPDYDLIQFLRSHGNGEVYMGDLPRLREKIEREIDHD